MAEEEERPAFDLEAARRKTILEAVTDYFRYLKLGERASLSQICSDTSYTVTPPEEIEKIICILCKPRMRDGKITESALLETEIDQKVGERFFWRIKED